MTVTLTREEAQQVLDALECMNEGAFNAEIKLLRDRLSAPESKPVAWNIKHDRPPLSSDNPHEVVAVIKREWQGLTDDEIKEIVGGWGSLPIDGYTRKLFDQIEVKLKEKNT